MPQQHLVLVRPANDIHSHIPLLLKHHDLVVVEDDVPCAGLRGWFLGFGKQAFFECLLEGGGGVRVGVGGVDVGGEGAVHGRGLRVRGGVVFGEDAGAVGGGEEEDGGDGEEGDGGVGGHGWWGVIPLKSSCKLIGGRFGGSC